ncbi:anaerobic ribonucleoside-triphosphate reductase activating protein [Spirochaetia bacterium]|nr:anaerobic ribonucleoside-triphosphate reductase activating protein [Spirochaetia bacterium]
MVIIQHQKITEVLGPGTRLAIWLAGCDKGCKNCINQEGQNEKAGSYYPLSEVFALIRKSIAKHEIGGITISGGEPFLQYDELKGLLSWIKSNTKLDTIVFTGYKLSDLLKKHGNIKNDVLNYIDVLIDGEYKEELNCGDYLRGSSNQNLYFFTGKYIHDERFNSLHKEREFEFEIKDGGETFFIGIPPIGFYDKFIEQLSTIAG